MKKKPLKTYNLKLTDQESLDVFSKFQVLVIPNGETVTDSILGMCKNYIEHKNIKDADLVTEAELIRRSKESEIPVGRSSLKKYRDLGVLSDEKGPWWWTNEDGNIVFNFNPVFEFLKKRKEDPFSRIVKNTDEEE